LLKVGHNFFGKNLIVYKIILLRGPMS